MTSAGHEPGLEGSLRPYVPRIATEWLANHPARTHREVVGTLLFSDISGFTRLTERLARKGKVGAEEMSDALNATFRELLTEAWRDGADLVKWGGDAVLLLFEGPDHAARACRAAHRMRARLAEVGRIETSSGGVRLRMSQGLHSGTFNFFLVGDPSLHRELLVCGPGVTHVLAHEGAASAGEIAVGESTAALIDPALLGAPVGAARLLRRCPELPESTWVPAQVDGADPSICLPAAIRDHLLLDDRQPEHRAIGVAFVKFSGTDGLLLDQGPEALAAALDDCVRNVSQAVAQYDVTFFESDVNADGGKIMLTAGAPRSSGHDAERLLRAARLIVERAGVLPLRVGVNVGRVFSGDFGPPFRRTYSVKGDAINLAARLVAKAEAGRVMATNQAVLQSHTAFLTTEHEPFLVKGKARPIRALDVGPVDAGRLRGSSHNALPLVGRQPEIEALAAAVAAARARAGSLVQVLGESGIGKSRLLEEAVGLASGLLVISVACDEYESSTPYHSIRLLLRDLLGIRPGLETAAVQQRLDDRVRDNDPALEDWLPLLGTVLDVPIPDNEHTSGLTDEFRKSRVDRVIVDTLHTLLPTPTMLTFDDVQFMDAASLDVLEAIAKRIRDEPWLLLVAARDEGSGPLEGLASATLRPTALSLADSRRLVHAVTDDHPLPTPVIDALAARSGGNPLFLGELAHASGGVDSDDSLPNSVEDLVTTQVDRLAPRDRTVLRYAAVLGMRCETSALRELVAGRAPAPDRATLGRLADFVVPDQVGSLRFRHALIRDVAYQGLPYRTRRVLHEQVATRLESTAAGSSQELLSYHFFHAGRFDKAWSYSTYAGRQARAKYANQEAVDLLTRAVEAERRAPTGMVPPQELGVVHEDLGDIWFRIGLSEEAAEAYRKARRELRGDPVSEARVVAKQARVDQRLSKLPQSLRRVTQALRALEPVEGTTAHAARSGLAMRYAISRFSQGRVNEAIKWGDRAAREAEEAVDRATLAHAYATLHGIYVAAERVSPIPYGEIALQAYTEIGDLYGQADCTNNLAVAALNENRWPEAADRFGAAAEIYRRVGDSQGEGIAIFNRAEVLVRQGNLDRVEGLLEEAMWTARSVSDQDLVALVLREMGRVRCRTGDFDDGLERLAQARAIFLDLDEVAEVPAVDVAVCEALMLRGSGHECLEATAPLLAADDRWLQATVRWIRGFAHLALDEPSAAEAELIAGSTIATELDDPYASAMCLLGLSMVRGSDPGADERADELLAGLGVVAVPVPGPRSTLRAATVRGT